jgi:hypothetical protein
MAELPLQVVRIGIALLLAATLVAVDAAKAPGYSGYKCGSHCYGINTWTSSAQYFGARTDISIARLSCDASTCAPGGLISDEMWLVDQTSSSCTQGQDGACWVEIGYIDDYAASKTLSQTFFWADERPNQPFGFELFQDVPDNAFGTTDHFVIINDQHITPAGFLVWLYNDSGTLFQGTSNDNAMMGTQIEIGQELYGTQGASAQTATFSNNMFATQPLGSDNMFVYTAQTARGSVTADNPINVQWVIDPATLAGGQFSTSCC